MKLIYLVALVTFLFLTKAHGQETTGGAKYPYWGDYHKTPLSEIKKARWIGKDTIIDGWDWSLPDGVKPSEKSKLCIARNFGLGKNKIEHLPEINFPANPVISHWVEWHELEPVEGEINFQPLIDNIKLAYEKGYGSIVRLHFSAIDFAPDWIKKYNIPIRKEHKENPIKTNYDPGHPEFHKRYIKFIKALGESGIPQMKEVKGLFLGYASPSNGDEGIGPHPEKFADANDTIAHVRERIDTWAEACKGVEHKVFMGGLSNYGFSKGFGIRRGFVEMYLYHIPDEHIGQKLDEHNYLVVDETNPVIANNLFQGEENEEYEEKWATDWRDFRFGRSTVSFPYRYFTANLRLLQMRCNYLLNNEFSLLPEMFSWVSLELGRTIEDAPDTWCFLRESYIKENGGRPVKNFERWLYQRDAPGYETEPAVKIKQAIQMWMVEPGKYYDFVARKGKKIGFDVDDNWKELNGSVAIKVSYFDNNSGALNLVYNNGQQETLKTILLSGDNHLKTATFVIDDLKINSLEHGFDFVLEAGKNTDSIVVSFVRVVHTDKTSSQIGSNVNPFPDDAWGVYSWGNNNPNNVSREKCRNIKGSPIIMRWSNLEPENGGNRDADFILVNTGATNCRYHMIAVEKTI